MTGGIEISSTQRLLAMQQDRLLRLIAERAANSRIRSSALDRIEFSNLVEQNSDLRVLRQVIGNVEEGLSLVSRADSGLRSLSHILFQLREMAQLASSSFMAVSSRPSLDKGFQVLLKEFDRVASGTESNGHNLLDGSLNADTPFYIQVGLNANADSRFNLSAIVDLEAVTASQLGIGKTSLKNPEQAVLALGAIDRSLEAVVAARGRIGVAARLLLQNLSQLHTRVDELNAAVDFLNDVAIAEELAFQTRQQILQRHAAHLSVQANLDPQSAFRLVTF